MSSPATLLEGYLTYCRAAGHRPATIKLRLSYLSRVPDLDVATGPELLAWLASHEWGPETRRSARSALRAFYGWAHAEGYRHDDPTERLPTVKVPAGQPRPTPDDVFERAMSIATDRDALMLALAAWAGLRRAEIARLRWDDLDWAGIRVTGKGGKVRNVPLGARLAELLRREADRRSIGHHGTGWRFGINPASPYVFPGREGGSTSPDTVGDLLKAALGGDRWSGHTLRHRFATRAYSAERDLLTVQQLLGHSKPETTARYTATPAGAGAAAVAAAAA